MVPWPRRPTGPAHTLVRYACDPYGRPDAGGSSVTDPKDKGSTLGFQGAITDKVSGSVVLGPRL